MGGKARLPRAARLRDRRDFRRVARSGRRVVSPFFVVLVNSSVEPQEDGPRLGVTVSRKVGNAVERNRVKRRIREWFRRTRASLAPDVELVVIARRQSLELLAREADAELSRLVAEGTQ